MAHKIAFIGAGSFGFTRKLVRDLLSYPAFADATIALMDIDPERLDVIRRACERIVTDGKYPAKIVATLDRREALEGAEGVVSTILHGSIDIWQNDILIPKKYGVVTNVGDTRAVYLNYTNPMAMLCRAVQGAHPGIVTSGLCHSVQGTAAMLARWIGAKPEEVTYTCAGINHQAFYIDYKWNGKDAYPLIRKAIPGWEWDNLLQPARDGWNRASAQELEVLYPEHRILEINAMPSKNGTVVLVRDVTLARAREESERESSRTDAVRDLAAGVAHEIGNPLNAISLNLQLLAREFRRESDEDRHTRLLHDISTAQNEVKRLEGIIKGFLSALRPAKLNLVPGTLLDPLTDTLEAMKAQFENRRIETALNLPTALPTVLVDRAQMEQVFFNLIKNALEAMKDGGSLDIEVSSDDHDVRVAFSDNGSGMDAATLAHIFEPYQTSKEHGSGLGLMLSRRIVHAHGGEIDVESKPGAGTVFTVRIPRLEKRVRRLK